MEDYLNFEPSYSNNEEKVVTRKFDIEEFYKIEKILEKSTFILNIFNEVEFKEYSLKYNDYIEYGEKKDHFPFNDFLKFDKECTIEVFTNKNYNNIFRNYKHFLSFLDEIKKRIKEKIKKKINIEIKLKIKEYKSENENKLKIISCEYLDSNLENKKYEDKDILNNKNYKEFEKFLETIIEKCNINEENENIEKNNNFNDIMKYLLIDKKKVGLFNSKNNQSNAQNKENNSIIINQNGRNNNKNMKESQLNQLIASSSQFLKYSYLEEIVKKYNDINVLYEYYSLKLKSNISSLNQTEKNKEILFKYITEELTQILKKSTFVLNIASKIGQCLIENTIKYESPQEGKIIVINDKFLFYKVDLLLISDNKALIKKYILFLKYFLKIKEIIINKFKNENKMEIKLKINENEVNNISCEYILVNPKLYIEKIYMDNNILNCVHKEFESFLNRIFNIMNIDNSIENKKKLIELEKIGFSSIQGNHKSKIDQNNIAINSLNEKKIKFNNIQKLDNIIEFIIHLNNVYFIACTKNNILLIYNQFFVKK